MARRAKIQLEANEDPELDISSLIDVSFLLLIFFIVTSTLLKREQELTLTLPTTPNPSTELNDPLLIEISEDGKITVDQLELEPAVSDVAARPVPALRKHLDEYKKLLKTVNEEPTVVLAAADGGKSQRFYDVVNALYALEISKVTMTGFREDG